MGLKSYFSTKKLARKFKSTADTGLLARQASEQSEGVYKSLDLVQYNTSPTNSRLKTSQTIATLNRRPTTPSQSSPQLSQPITSRDNPCTCWTFRSLPGSTSGAGNHPESTTRDYDSLPYITSQPRCTCSMASRNMRARRSRIRTNPWLPLPQSPASETKGGDDANGEFTRRFMTTADQQRRPEPRLSRFISEVEEIMREQLSPSVVASPGLGHRRTLKPRYSTDESDSDTTLSMRSTPRSQSPNTPSHPLTSPSEGYKSGIDEPTDCSSQEQEVPVKLRPMPVRPQISELLTQSLYEPQICRNSYMSISTLSLSGGGDSLMSSSFTSQKTELLQEKVKKICQSNSQLNEQMRLAKLETQLLTVQD